MTERAPCPRLFLACGQQDSLYPANLRLRDTLQAMNWPLTWYEAPGDHNWFFWNDALGRAMKELFGKLGQYRIILSADTASEVRQLLGQKRR